MQFTPLPGEPALLLSIWDTRVSDYRSFVTNFNYTNNMKWDNPNYVNDDANPVVWVSYEDALKFCDWLTTDERKQRKLLTQSGLSTAGRTENGAGQWDFPMKRETPQKNAAKLFHRISMGGHGLRRQEPEISQLPATLTV